MLGCILFNNMSFDFSCGFDSLGFNYYSLCIEDGAYGSSMSENVEFMRKAVYDYSDELWEELNNGPIASSEMNLNNSSVVMNGNGLIDLSSPSILKFNNVNSNTTNQNGNNDEGNKSIIDVVTNPKT